jgi:hypothetical protein
MRVAIGRIVAWASVAAALAGCASDPTPRMSAAPASPCLLEQSPLLLADGTELYVEPQNLFRLGDEWMVAGAPSYQWSVAPGRDAVSVTREAYVAVALDTPARAVPKALPDGRIGSMLATPLGNNRWAAIFDDVDPDSIHALAPPQGYWYGEHDGRRWTLVERLPTPPGSQPDLRQSSDLVRVGDRLVWIAFERGRVGTILHRYERRDGVWLHERMPDEFVEHLAIGLDAESRLWIALAGQDAGLPTHARTIRLYREGSPRELVSRVETLVGGPMILQLFVDVRDGAATVSWVTLGADGSRAYARAGIRPDSAGPVVLLDDSALHLYPMTMSDSSLAWIAEHQDGRTRRKELELLRLDDMRVSRVASAPSPFTGFFRAKSNGPDEVLLVGAQMGVVQTETPVRSLILRLSTSC